VYMHAYVCIYVAVGVCVDLCVSVCVGRVPVCSRRRETERECVKGRRDTGRKEHKR
jgi:hypothetical protein